MGARPFVAVFSAFMAFTAFSAGAGERTVEILPGEHWWGLGTAFGSQMPFTAKSDFSCDLNADNYANQTMSLLVSDKGRVLWCDEPIAATIAAGSMRVVSGKGEVILREDAGRNLAEAYRFASKTWFPPSGEYPDLLYFAAPQYNTWIELTYHQNEKDILGYAQSMIDHGLPPGVFMIDDTWQLGYGVWEFDPRRFSDPRGMVAKLHAMGFKVLLWMCPFVSMDSPAYRLLELGKSPDVRRSAPRGGFVTDPATGRAAAVNWWNGRSALVDMSHPSGREWLCGRLDWLMSTYGVDAFKFDNGGVCDYFGVRAQREGLSAAAQNGLYADLALCYRGSELRSAFGMGGKPVVMRLHDKRHAWEDLAKLVPDMLAAGLIGTPFVCPDMIGGGSWESFLPGASFEPELFIRSAQIHALCPMMQISASPWRVLDAEHREIFQRIVALRQKFAPAFVELAKESAKSGEPIMRNLEYNYPNMGYSDIRDEFMMGTDLLVAPVVTKGNSSREIVLPPGRWLADDGNLFEGARRIVVKTPLDRIPHFARKK